ncbi:ATP-binding protein [Frateuria terrea]|uniref:Anti-sigma regulatory factor (Ser/Thr protein kinase) n=1 Tax=Frateuria terrea TaxID=529704 RepID=A0A1H6UIL5_9GAMM|nr:ATP-binding protein [Frateuria terrea]SEI91556.1 Anti-sigma regulatory factor (Ser/Thr protein kinase) [Frateuria terrea]SFP35869.1 Anti-sigma regulatory factor (Ser/Thr protein kinase) [Frateuria terrea]
MDVAGTGSPTLVLPLDDASQVGHARRTTLQTAQRIGFDETDAGRAALVATELSSNVLKHAMRGELHLQVVPGRDGPGLEIVAVDRGPGFDVAACLVDGYSSRGSQGIGLGALVRQAQVFDAHADARGAVVLARLFPRQHTRRQDLRFGISHHALHGEPASGDTWRLAIDGARLSALVIDGLGHGVAAAEAAKAGAAAFVREPFDAPETILARAHAGMASTRGGAFAICQYDGAGTLRFLGIGNIAGSLVGAEQSRGLASHPGIVGGQFRKPTVFSYPASSGQLLIMHSDGLQARWRLGDYAGLWRRHPGVVAAVLNRDYCRGRDDTTVLVASMETPRE